MAEPDKSANRDVSVARIAGRQHGMVTARDLAACGLHRNAIAVRVARGNLHPQHRGVFAVGHDAITQTACFAAAVLACGAGAVLSAAAAVHLGLLAHHDGAIDVIVPGSGGRKLKGIRPHRSRLDPRDVWTRDAIRVTSPARTILDVAATMAPNPLRRLARQAQAEQHVNVVNCWTSSIATRVTAAQRGCAP